MMFDAAPWMHLRNVMIVIAEFIMITTNKYYEILNLWGKSFILTLIHEL